jgi:hypothetical protein
LDAAEEGEKDIDAEDPADGAFIVGGKLVLAEVGLEDADGVPWGDLVGMMGMGRMVD